MEETKVQTEAENGQQHSDPGSEITGEDNQQSFPAVRGNHVRVFEVSLGMFYLLILAALMIRYVSVTLEKDQLETKYGKWCPEGWRRFGCSCYYKSTEKKTWSESRRLCQERGADLVIINSKEEQKFVRYLNMNGDSWIGLKPEPQEWRWVDGSPLTKKFWAAGWPKHQHYLYAATCCDGEGKWTESHYDDDKSWICEK